MMRLVLIASLLGVTVAWGHREHGKKCDLPCPEGTRCRVKDGQEQCVEGRHKRGRERKEKVREWWKGHMEKMEEGSTPEEMWARMEAWWQENKGTEEAKHWERIRDWVMRHEGEQEESAGHHWQLATERMAQHGMDESMGKDDDDDADDSERRHGRRHRNRRGRRHMEGDDDDDDDDDDKDGDGDDHRRRKLIILLNAIGWGVFLAACLVACICFKRKRTESPPAVATGNPLDDIAPDSVKPTEVVVINEPVKEEGTTEI